MALAAPPGETGLARCGALVRAAPARRRPGALARLRQALAVVVLGGVLVLLGRALWDSVLDRLEARRDVHPDQTEASSGVRPERARLAWLVYRTLDGREVRALVDAGRLSAFLRERIEWLESSRAPLRAEAASRLGEAVAPTFEAIAGRVPGFVDWYLAWGTGYELLAVAALSAASHALEPRVTDLREVVRLDLERHVERRYRDQVLRPEGSDPALRDAYLQVLTTLHGRVLGLVAALDAAFQAYLAEESALLDGARVPAQAELTLDWSGRARRLALPDIGAGPIETVRGAALAGGGALAGAATGRAAARALTGGLAARPAGARLAARLAGPATGRLLAGAAGATAGAAAGPLGAAIGGALGLGVDYAVSEAGAALQRPELEDTVQATLAAHRAEWVALMGASLVTAVDAWLDDLQAHLAEHGGP